MRDVGISHWPEGLPVVHAARPFKSENPSLGLFSNPPETHSEPSGSPVFPRRKTWRKC